MKILVSYQVNDKGQLSEKDTELEIPSGVYLYNAGAIPSDIYNSHETVWDDVLGRARMMLMSKEAGGASIRIWHIKTV